MLESKKSASSTWLRWPITLIVSLGVGLLPGPRGTYGSLLTAGAALIWLAQGGPEFSGVWFVVFLVLLAALAVGSSQVAVNLGLFDGKKDPHQVVIDEALGQMVTYYGLSAIGRETIWLGLSVTTWTMLAGFLLFRVFDVLKPWPVGKSQELPGGWGIVMDDFLAAIYAWACLQLGIRLLG